MTLEAIKNLLNENWDENGFFEKLRYDRFIDFQKGNHLLNSLKEYKIESSDLIDSELVRLLWLIPIFMDWQKDQLSKSSTEENMKLYNNLLNKFHNELERIFGMP